MRAIALFAGVLAVSALFIFLITPNMYTTVSAMFASSGNVSAPNASTSNVSAGIPKLLWQTTYLDPAQVPTRSLLGEYAAGYEHTIADDAACEAFIVDHFPYAAETWRALRGAHRADLWRYFVLYVHGGVYLDIKTVLHQPLDELFPSRGDKLTWYTVVCTTQLDCIYNGIIASPPGNPIFLTLIEYMITHPMTCNLPHLWCPTYHAYVKHAKRAIEERYGATVRGDTVLEDAETRVVLRSEICADDECQRTPKKRKDQYGLCCNVYDRAVDPQSPVITVRDADYPWGTWRHRTWRSVALPVGVVAAAVLCVALARRNVGGRRPRPEVAPARSVDGFDRL
jgi:hypothetical protein